MEKVAKLKEMNGGSLVKNGNWKTEGKLDGTETLLAVWPVADKSIAKLYTPSLAVKIGRVQTALVRDEPASSAPVSRQEKHRLWISRPLGCRCA